MYLDNSRPNLSRPNLSFLLGESCGSRKTIIFIVREGWRPHDMVNFD